MLFVVALLTVKDFWANATRDAADLARRMGSQRALQASGCVLRAQGARGEIRLDIRKPPPSATTLAACDRDRFSVLGDHSPVGRKPLILNFSR
jgi:hypothetical protein